MQTKHAHDALIDALGGTRVVAELCRVTDAAVSQWRWEGIPDARLMYLRLAAPKVFRAWTASEKAAA